MNPFRQNSCIARSLAQLSCNLMLLLKTWVAGVDFGRHRSRVQTDRASYKSSNKNHQRRAGLQ